MGRAFGEECISNEVIVQSERNASEMENSMHTDTQSAPPGRISASRPSPLMYPRVIAAMYLRGPLRIAPRSWVFSLER